MSAIIDILTFNFGALKHTWSIWSDSKKSNIFKHSETVTFQLITTNIISLISNYISIRNKSIIQVLAMIIQFYTTKNKEDKSHKMFKSLYERVAV